MTKERATVTWKVVAGTKNRSCFLNLIWTGVKFRRPFGTGAEFSRTLLLCGVWVVDAQSQDFVGVDWRGDTIRSRNRQRRSLRLLDQVGHGRCRGSLRKVKFDVAALARPLI